jgi:hypothetical protein
MATTSRARRSRSSSALLPAIPQFALSQALPRERLVGLAADLGSSGRQRVFDPYVTLLSTVDQALGGQCSQAAATARLAAAAGLALDPDSGAFCRARAALPSGLAQAAAQQVARGAFDLTPGRRTWLVDGTCIALAPSGANQQRYPQSTTQPPGCGEPQIHCVALTDAASGAIAQLALGTLRQHDAHLAQGLWHQVAPGDIVVADRGFASYNLLAGAARRGFYVVVRQHQRRRNALALGPDDATDDRWETWSVPAKRAAWWEADLPPSLTVRVVRTRRDDGTILTLNTNLPPEAADTARILALYQQRWRVETRFFELKVTLGLEPLRASTPERAEQLLWCWVLAFNLVCLLLTQAAVESGLDRWRLSFSGAVAALGAAALLPTRDPAVAWKWVLAQVSRNPLPQRRTACRDEPRMHRRRHRAYPYMTRPRQTYHRGPRSVRSEPVAAEPMAA